ncbi:MAG: hypothetical protein HY594_04565, partial [Candidatus Omnitrophica bacterium]|nr:hypothetical protein [Candidatus Omnitrophota bacterium]
NKNKNKNVLSAIQALGPAAATPEILEGLRLIRSFTRDKDKDIDTILRAVASALGPVVYLPGQFEKEIEPLMPEGTDIPEEATEAVVLPALPLLAYRSAEQASFIDPLISSLEMVQVVTLTDSIMPPAIVLHLGEARPRAESGFTFVRMDDLPDEPLQRRWIFLRRMMPGGSPVSSVAVGIVAEQRLTDGRLAVFFA